MQDQILSAFDHRRRPAIVTTVEVCSSLKEDARHFEGMDWGQVKVEDWAEYSDAFFGFSPGAFVYFLPSILTLSLAHPNQPLAAADALATCLDTSADPDIWPEWFAERFSILTLRELRVLKSWTNAYLAEREKGEGSQFARVKDTLTMLELLVGA